MGEGYVRIWVKGGDDLAEEVLARWDDAWFEQHAPGVQYIGSARVGHEGSVPGPDRCQVLLGVRGEDEAINGAAEALDAEDEVKRTEVLLVEETIVNRPAEEETFPLIPPEEE
jgi:hypothetical protein